MIYCITENKRYDITSIVDKNFSWSKTLDEFAQKLSFNILDVKQPGLPVNPVKEGSIIELIIEGHLEFSGIVLATSFNNDKMSCSVVDFMFYINQNKEIYQFSKTNASNCVRSILEGMGAPVGEIDPSMVVIDKIFFTQSAGSVIKEIIEIIESETSIKYIFYYRTGRFNFKKMSDTIKTFELNYYNKNINPLFLEENFNLERSIEELKNSVKVVIKNNETDYTFKEAKDSTSIAKYGLLQEVETIEAEKSDLAESMAKNILKEKNKVSEKIGITIPFVSGLYDGDNLIIKNAKIDGVYRVYSFDKTLERISLGLIKDGK